MKIKAAACAELAGGLDWASPGTERVELEQLFPLPTIVPPSAIRVWAVMLRLDNGFAGILLVKLTLQLMLLIGTPAAEPAGR